jgi:adenylate cyclase
MSLKIERKLTTILAADVAGYSRLMEKDEVGTLNALRSARAVFDRFIERHSGRIANTAGDGLIAEFPSVVEAVQCALEVQQELGAKRRDGGQLRFRIGIHLGDVMVDGRDLLGEGVNLAARLESMAEPGGILISQQVYDQVRSKLSVGFDYLGEKRPKNYSEDVPVYSVLHGEPGGWFQRGPTPPPSSPRPPKATPDLTQAWSLRVVMLAVAIWTPLLVIDLVTGDPFWAHWPGIPLAMIVGLILTPRLVTGRVARLLARLVVIVAGLALINLFTWQGYAWFLWPAGALATLTAIRLILRRT